MYALALLVGWTLAPAAETTALDCLLEGCPVRSIVPEHQRVPRSDELRFLVAGHLYGAPGFAGNGWISRNFRESIAGLKRLRPDLLVSLGDLVRTSSPSSFDVAVGRLSKLGVPVFNAPGNHDISSRRAYYEQRFGRTFGAFRSGRNLLVFLDTERTPWSLDQQQVAFLRRLLMLAAPEAEGEIRNVFLFAHKLIFAAEDPRYRPLFRHCNSRQEYPGGSNFGGEVLPILAGFRRFADVYWFSGDIGVSWSYGMFFDRHPESGVVFCATGIGDTEHDNLLSVQVSSEGDVSLDRIPIGGASLPPLEECGPDFWRQYFAALLQAEK